MASPSPPQRKPVSQHLHAGTHDRARHIESLIQSYHAQFGPLEKKQTQKSPAPQPRHHVVLLTGSTGALGSYMLTDLLKDARVRRVYTLNRSGGSTSVYARQSSSFRDHNLDEGLLSSPKLVSLEGDLTDARLGLPSSSYDELRASVTLVIHNAWEVDLKSPVAAFEPSLKGALNLINLARSSRSPHSLRFLFISSVLSMQNLGVDATVPEAIVPNASVCLGTGYGESKYIVERLLGVSGVEACTIRIAQLYGENSRCTWPVTGWLPYLIASGVTMRQMPLPSGSATWLPMDFAAKAALDTAFYDGALPLAINIAHPKPVPTSFIFGAFRDAVYDRSQGRLSLPLVPLKQWLRNVRASTKSGSPTSGLPVLKLVRFFQHVADAEEQMNDSHEVGRLPRFETAVAQRISPSLKDAHTLERDVVFKWVDYWIQEGLLAVLAPPRSGAKL